MKQSQGNDTLTGLERERKMVYVFIDQWLYLTLPGKMFMNYNLAFKYNISFMSIDDGIFI